MMSEPDKDERLAITRLKKLQAEWPRSLWIFAAGEQLYVMRRGSDGEQVMTDRGSVDQDYIVTAIKIPSDGGDW